MLKNNNVIHLLPIQVFLHEKSVAIFTRIDINVLKYRVLYVFIA